jgi:hypothetical protein
VHLRRPQNKKLQYAVLAAAALHGGTDPDLLDEVAWRQTGDFWQYALFAAVAYIRAAASRAGVPGDVDLDVSGSKPENQPMEAHWPGIRGGQTSILTMSGRSSRATAAGRAAGRSGLDVLQVF